MTWILAHVCNESDVGIRGTLVERNVNKEFSSVIGKEEKPPRESVQKQKLSISEINPIFRQEQKKKTEKKKTETISQSNKRATSGMDGHAKTKSKDNDLETGRRRDISVPSGFTNSGLKLDKNANHPMFSSKRHAIPRLAPNVETF